MSLAHLRTALSILSVASAAQAQIIHTPQPGSAERQAICDAARAYVLAKYPMKALPQPIVFKIEHLAVTGGYGNMEAIPLFKDGSYIDPQYLPDVAYNFCLKRTAADWQVIVDLSRSDVPDPAEAQSLKRTMPADFPLAVLSPTWRKLLTQ